jgi:hypothetical protein
VRAGLGLKEEAPAAEEAGADLAGRDEEKDAQDADDGPPIWTPAAHTLASSESEDSQEELAGGGRRSEDASGDEYDWSDEEAAGAEHATVVRQPGRRAKSARPHANGQDSSAPGRCCARPPGKECTTGTDGGRPSACVGPLAQKKARK